MAFNAGTNAFAPVTSTLQVCLTDENGLAMLAKCTGSPPTTANSFSKGCLMIQTDATTGNANLYSNVGTSASVSWNLVGAISPGEITLAEGNVLIGNGSGVAAAVNAKTSGQILVGSGTTLASVAVSGDATLASNGALTIANSAITNAKVDAAAAIDYSKLAALTSGNILVGSAGNVATSVAMSGDTTISNTGAVTIANSAVTNAKVDAAAAIDFSKLAALPSAQILVGSAANVPTAVAVSGDVTMSNTGVVTITNQAQYVEIAVSKVDILQLNTVPKELVAAQAGIAYEVISATVIYDFDTAAYTAGGNVNVQYAGGVALTGTVSAANSIGAGADSISYLQAVVPTNNQLLANTALQLVAAADFTDPGTAAGVVRLQIAYRSHTTGL